MFERFDYLWKRDGPKVGTFGPILTPLSLLVMTQIKKKKKKKKKKQSCGKTSVIKLSKYFKMNSLSHLPFPGNI